MSAYTIFTTKDSQKHHTNDFEVVGAFLGKDKIWVYDRNHGTWWVTEMDFFNDTVLVMCSKRKVPPEYQATILLLS